MDVNNYPPSKEIFEVRPDTEQARSDTQAGWQSALEAAQTKAIQDYFTDPSSTELKEDSPFVSGMAYIACRCDALCLNDGDILMRAAFPLATFKLLDELTIGTTRYPFIESASAVYDPSSTSLIVFPLHKLGLFSQAASFETALLGLSSEFHLLYQSLESKVPHGLNGEEEKDWKTITSCIDIRLYRELTPISIQRIGQVAKRRPFLIQWIDEDSPYEVRLSDAPAQLAGVDIGAWVTATVEFDRKHWRILKILSVNPIDPPYSGHDAGPTAIGLSDLPSESWDSL